MIKILPLILFSLFKILISPVLATSLEEDTPPSKRLKQNDVSYEISFNNLPDDTVLVIMEQARILDGVRLGSTSVRFKRLIDSSLIIWKQYFLRIPGNHRFSLQLESPKKNETQPEFNLRLAKDYRETLKKLTAPQLITFPKINVDFESTVSLSANGNFFGLTLLSGEDEETERYASIVDRKNFSSVSLRGTNEEFDTFITAISNDGSIILGYQTERGTEEETQPLLWIKEEKIYTPHLLPGITFNDRNESSSMTPSGDLIVGQTINKANVIRPFRVINGKVEIIESDEFDNESDVENIVISADGTTIVGCLLEGDIKQSPFILINENDMLFIETLNPYNSYDPIAVSRDGTIVAANVIKASDAIEPEFPNQSLWLWQKGQGIKFLTLPSKYASGWLTRMSEDGQVLAGSLSPLKSNKDLGLEEASLWFLSLNQVINLNNLLQPLGARLLNVKSLSADGTAMMLLGIYEELKRIYYFYCPRIDSWQEEGIHLPLSLIEGSFTL